MTTKKRSLMEKLLAPFANSPLVRAVGRFYPRKGPIRLLVIGKPASGVFNVAQMLASILSLPYVNKTTNNILDGGDELADYIAEQQAEQGVVIATNVAPTSALLEACRNSSFCYCLILRDPYVNFELQYLHANKPERDDVAHPIMDISGLPLKLQDLEPYLMTNYKTQLEVDAAWFAQEKMSTFRHEEIAADPVRSIFEIIQTLGAAKGISEESVAQQLQEQPDIAFNTYGYNDASELRIPPDIVQKIGEITPRTLFYPLYQQREADLLDPIGTISGKFGHFLTEYSHAHRVFLVGSGKSGTTWLHMMMFHHPNTVAVAERRLIEHPDDNHALLDWFIDDELFMSWFTSSSFGKRYPEQVMIRHELERIISDYLLYRALLLRRSNKGLTRSEPITHVSEKIALSSKADADATISTLREIYPRSKIIHIIRDPRDVVISTLFHAYRDFVKAGENNWITDLIDQTEVAEDSSSIEEYFTDFVHQTTESWVDIVNTFHHTGKEIYGTDYKVVKYEDLVADPHRWISELFAFVSLDNSPEVVAEIVEQTSFNALSNGRMAGEQDKNSFFRKGEPGDWVNYFSPKEQAVVAEVAGEIMRDFQYQ